MIAPDTALIFLPLNSVPGKTETTLQGCQSAAKTQNKLCQFKLGPNYSHSNNWKSTEQRTQTSYWQSTKRGTRKLKERVYLILMIISFLFKARLVCLLSSYLVVFIILNSNKTIAKNNPDWVVQELNSQLKTRAQLLEAWLASTSV